MKKEIFYALLDENNRNDGRIDLYLKNDKNLKIITQLALLVIVCREISWFLAVKYRNKTQISYKQIISSLK